METTIKEKYWKDGNIFIFNTGDIRFIWDENAISDYNCPIHKNSFNNDLIIPNHPIGVSVIKVYSPNTMAKSFKDLIKIVHSKLLWQRTGYIITMQEIREKFDVPNNEKLIIVKN